MKKFRKFYVLISDCVAEGLAEEVSKTMFLTKNWEFTENIEEAIHFKNRQVALYFLADAPWNKKGPVYNNLRVKDASVEYNW